MHVRYDMITCYAVRPTSESFEFLQLHRVPEDFMGNTWQAISGGIEPGETAWRAALRELKEEAGLTPMAFYRLPVVNTFYISVSDTIWHSATFCAIVDPAAEIVLDHEHNGFRWIARDEADKAFMWATDRMAIAQLCREILDVKLDGGSDQNRDAVLDVNYAKPYLRIDHT